MKPTVVIFIMLALVACSGGQGPSNSTDDGRGVAPPGATPPTPPLQSSPIVGPSWHGSVSGNENLVFANDATFTTGVCNNTWRIDGFTDNTFAPPGQLVQLVHVATTGAYDFWCLLPVNTPYTCTVKRSYDSTLHLWNLNLSCDHGFSRSYFSP